MDNEYEKAWNDGEENVPAVNPVKSQAKADADRQAKEFSDAFFADKPGTDQTDDNVEETQTGNPGDSSDIDHMSEDELQRAAAKVE